ncbi:MAG TPA: pitrilysin family protein [Methylomirabilota bacterium]|jgi:predicted Zn-dependent peptidase|nr:pitrilysin family protein [Methylomirabilota bacterium]
MPAPGPRLTILIAGTLFFLAAGPCHAESVKSRLANGLTVLVAENRAAPLVAASLFVRVGARWETEGTAGITALLQQLLMKGTTSRSALDIALAAEDIGGSVSATSDPDFSEIRGTALGRHWRRLLELIADTALHPSLPEDELEAERRQLLRAIRNRQDQPFALAVDTLMGRLYGSHPYGWPALGRAAAVEQLDRAALRAHYARHYRARRMILSVSGDVGTREVVAEATRLFGEAPAGDDERDAITSAPSPPGDATTVDHPSAQAQVLMGFVAPPIGHADYAAMKVLSSALGGGMGGRLFTELRDKQGLAYSTSASYPSRVGPSYLLTQMGTAPTGRVRAEEAMRREIDRIRHDGVTAAELARAKRYLLGQFALDRRTNARVAWYAAFFESAGVGHDFGRQYVRAVEAVTTEDIQRVATQYLGSPTVVSLGPGAR